MRYATGLARNPHATYRQIDIAGRTSTDSHGLVAVLYEEAVAALRSAAWALEHRNLAMKSEKIARATAVLFALEAGLDFDKGGDVSRSLATFYHGLREQVVQASLGKNPAPFRDAANSLEEIASAWASLRTAS